MSDEDSAGAADAAATGESDDLAELRRELSEAESSGDQEATLSALHRMGTQLFNEGEASAAQEKFGAALSIARELDDQEGEAACLTNIAACAGQLGEHAVARNLLSEALDLRRQLGDDKGAAACLHELALLAARQGDDGNAENNYAEALRLRQASGDRNGEAMTFNNIGLLAVERGRHDAGMALLVLAFGLARLNESPAEQQILGSVQHLSDEMGYDERDLNELVERVLASYREDQGQQLLQAAFG